MKTSHYQRKFALMLAALICKASGLSKVAGAIMEVVYWRGNVSERWSEGVTISWVFRNPPTNVSVGGSHNSLHMEKLAADLNLFLEDEYQRATEAHLPLGEWWEKHGGSWGGRFRRGDGNHYSHPYRGRR